MSVPNHFRPTGHSPRLCYVTDRTLLPADSVPFETLIRKMEALAAAGVDWIQIREKDLSGKELAVLSHAAIKAASPNPAVRILINDRLDVALAERAAGVHLTEASLPVRQALRLVKARCTTEPPDYNFLTGVSCHSLDSALAAVQSGASYIFFGPVFATPSKFSYGNPQGIDRLHEVCRAIPIPVFAIGGITLENVSACLSAGAAGIAAIRLFQEAGDAVKLIGHLRSL